MGNAQKGKTINQSLAIFNLYYLLTYFYIYIFFNKKFILNVNC